MKEMSLIVMSLIHNVSQWQLITFLPQVTKEEFVKNAMKSPFIASLLN